MELQKIALKNKIKTADIETNKTIFIYFVKNKIHYTINKNGVYFNISDLSDNHTKEINKILNKLKCNNTAIEINKNLLLEF